MTDVDRILAGFIEAHRGGSDPDVGDWVQRVPAADRPELAALIDGYLVRAPGRKWDPEAYKDSSAERFVNSFAPVLESAAGLWPALLPRLRHEAQIKRSDLVAQLASDLGVQDRQDKVADYYHQMEQGSLDPAGVSERVLDALGRIAQHERRGPLEDGEDLFLNALDVPAAPRVRRQPSRRR